MSSIVAQSVFVLNQTEHITVGLWHFVTYFHWTV